MLWVRREAKTDSSIFFYTASFSSLFFKDGAFKKKLMHICKLLKNYRSWNVFYAPPWNENVCGVVQ